MPMLTVRLSDEEHAQLKELAGTGSVAALIKGWIAQSTYATPRTTPIEAEGGLVRTPEKAKDWGRIIAPAPNDECANCGHDKQSFHLGGKCEFPLGRRRCPCPAFVEDLGF